MNLTAGGAGGSSPPPDVIVVVDVTTIDLKEQAFDAMQAALEKLWEQGLGAVGRLLVNGKQRGGISRGITMYVADDSQQRNERM